MSTPEKGTQEYIDWRMEVIRQERNAIVLTYLQNNNWKIERHRHQLDLITEELLDATTLSQSTINSILNYVQELRDVPQNIVDVDAVEWPVEP